LGLGFRAFASTVNATERATPPISSPEQDGRAGRPPHVPSPLGKKAAAAGWGGCWLWHSKPMRRPGAA